MNIEKVKALNEEILEKAIKNVELRHLQGSWDLESFEAMTDAIKNIKNMLKIESMVEKDQVIEYSNESKSYLLNQETDFSNCVSDIVSAKGNEGIDAIMYIIAELMEDLKVLHKKMYDNTMMKMRDIKNA